MRRASLPSRRSLTLFSKKRYLELTQCLPGLAIPKAIGNSYTASLYFCLVSLLGDVSLDLCDKTVLFFSYGSGCAASLFSASITPAYTQLAAKVREALGSLVDCRVEIPPEVLFKRKTQAEDNYFRKGYEPEVHMECDNRAT